MSCALPFAVRETLIYPFRKEAFLWTFKLIAEHLKSIGYNGHFGPFVYIGTYNYFLVGGVSRRQSSRRQSGLSSSHALTESCSRPIIGPLIGNNVGHYSFFAFLMKIIVGLMRNILIVSFMHVMVLGTASPFGKCKCEDIAHLPGLDVRIQKFRSQPSYLYGSRL